MWHGDKHKLIYNLSNNTEIYFRRKALIIQMAKEGNSKS